MSVARKNNLTTSQVAALARATEAAEKYRSALVNARAEIEARVRAELAEHFAVARDAFRKARAERYSDGRYTTKAELMRAYGTKDARTIDELLGDFEPETIVVDQFEVAGDVVVVRFFEYAGVRVEGLSSFKIVHGLPAIFDNPDDRYTAKALDDNEWGQAFLSALSEFLDGKVEK